MSARALDDRLDQLATLLGGHIAGAYRAGELTRDEAAEMFAQAAEHAAELQGIIARLDRLNGSVVALDLGRFIAEENDAIDVGRSRR